MDGFADVHGVSTHFDGQRYLANHVAAEGLAVAVDVGRVIKREGFSIHRYRSDSCALLPCSVD